MVVYDKEEQRVIIPAHINYETYNAYKEGYNDGYSSGYTDGLNSCVIEYDKMYFTIEALEDGTITPRKNVGYSINGGDWIEGTAEVGIPVSSGDTVRFKFVSGNGADPGGLFSGNTLPCNVYGNIESLEYGDDYIGQTEQRGVLSFLLSGCTGLVSAENLIIPLTAITYTCGSMFSNCTSLLTAPELPATTLTANSCYAGMFSNCTNLVTAPSLPATTIKQSCYQSMFNGCTNLTTAPELPATTLDKMCYYAMFSNCRSLIKAPSVLPATTLPTQAYYTMFMDCKSLETAPEISATTTSGFNNCHSMFSGCTSLTKAPSAVPITTLQIGCCSSMFAGCTSLERAPELPDALLQNANMTAYVSMFSGCTRLNYIKCMSTQRSDYLERCTNGWVTDVSPTGTFVKNPNMSGWTTGVNGIPEGWTVVDAT